ncbi:MAG TPA: hypothetical protein VE650_10420 [Acetobacteraceae bacterium]|jgi:hypothetical protein|nr:hypothetical protein [Acetobacteraceae bacterium]
MSRKRPSLLDDYATIRVTHHALSRERAEMLRRRPGPKSSKPECLVIGHAWTEDPARHGGTICMVCQLVRWP